MLPVLLAAFHLVPTVTTKAAPKAAAVASATGGGAGSYSGEGVVIALGLLGVLVVLGLVGYVVLRVVQKKDESESRENKFVAPRRWGWEQSLSESEEAALLGGLAAWENGDRSLNLNHEDGTATLYLPGRLVIVSLFLLAARVQAAGAPGHDPASVVRLVEELSATLQPGVLAFAESWFAVGRLDGMDHDAFLSKVRDTLTSGFDQGLSGSQGWYSDENYGRIDLRLLAEPSDEARRLRDEQKFEAVAAAESKTRNTLLLDAGPLVDRYQKLRAAQPSVSPDDAIRTLLVELLASAGPEFTWARVPASATELALVQSSAAGRSSF